MTTRLHPILRSGLLLFTLLICGCASHTGPYEIFNGRDLTGWDGDPKFWRVEEGAITGETTPHTPAAHNTFIIFRGATVSNFELTLEYRVCSDWANSGVQYRAFELSSTSDDDRWIVGGYQADIDEPVHYTGILYGELDRGILASRGERVVIDPGGKPRVTGSLGSAEELARYIRPKGQWNQYRITADGNHIEQCINGVVVTDVTDLDALAISPGVKGARASGVLALQIHTGSPMKVQFRNIHLRTLP